MTKNIVLILLAAIFIFGCAEKQTSVSIYVSQDGDDSWSGMLAEPDKNGADGPFLTFEKARDAIREMRQSGTIPDGEVTIFMKGGAYRIDETFTLTAEDSGTESSPVVWRAYPGEVVSLIGGEDIDDFKPVTDESILSRVNKDSRSMIVFTDLNEAGIDNLGSFDPASGNRIELFFKGKFMTVARYPNEEWLKIAGVPQTGEKMINKGLDRDKSAVPRGRHYGRFTYPDDRPLKWADSSDLWVHGYWTWDWSDQYMKVDKIDTKKRDIYPTEPHHGYGYTKNQRFYFLNVLEELDAPGEWYLDSAKGLLYFYPPEIIADGDVFVSTFADVMISLENASHITIRDIVFEGSRGAAIHVTDGSDNLIAGCTFRNLGQTAVNITGGKNNGIRSCDIYEVAAGGVDLHGGDRKTLEAAGNYAINNHIHDFGIRLKTYRPGVQTTGVGNRIAHNLIHDAPHCGIFLMTSKMGNDHIIEYNELHSLAKETGDVGAIYLCGRDFTMRGNVVRYNYLHNLKGPGLHGVMAIYLDDFTSGTEVYGNVCYQAGRAILIGGGRDNTINNNIFIECDPSVHVDARGTGWAKYYFENNNTLQDLMDAVDYKNPPYSVRYPELLTVQDDEPAIAKGNRITNNISSGGRWLDLYDRLDYSIVSVSNNLVSDPVLSRWLREGANGFKNYDYGDDELMKILEDNGNHLTESDPGFPDPGNGDFTLPDDSPARELGFEDIPMEKIGLYIDKYRTELPE